MRRTALSIILLTIILNTYAIDGLLVKTIDFKSMISKVEDPLKVELYE